MEERWRRFTSTIRKHLSQISPDAASPSQTVSPAVPAPSPSPAPDAKPVYIPVSKADAIARLCLLTDDPQLDHLHVILIELIQKDLIGAVHAETDDTLRYFATENGKKFVDEHLHQAVDALLERIFGDQGHT
jgi:hypothetical protein